MRKQQKDVLPLTTHYTKHTSYLFAYLAALLLLACQKNEYLVEMKYTDVKSGRELPYGAVHRIDLTPIDSIDQAYKVPEHLRESSLVAKLLMGNSGTPIYMLFGKSDSTNLYYDNLLIDRNKDHDFTNDGSLYTGAGQFITSRNRHYTEFDNVALPYEWRFENTFTEEPFLCKLFFWYPDENGVPKTCSVLRLCWREGAFTYKKQQAKIVFVDDDCNGLYDTNDRWALFPKDSLDEKYVTNLRFFRDATRYGWLGNKAFELIGISPRGNSVRLREKMVEVTKADDLAADTPYSHEVRRPRAARDISWMADYRSAFRKAGRSKQNILVNFCTSWSGPCLILEERTFNDAEVVSLTSEYVCLKLHGDTERILAKQFNIQNYPTLLILDSRGKELSRVVGYQPAAEFTKFLLRYKK